MQLRRQYRAAATSALGPKDYSASHVHHAKMGTFCNSNKGQLTLEAGIILLYILIILTSFWLGGPVQQSTEKSTDTNGILLANNAVDLIASNVEITGMSGTGARKDFTVHVPFNTVAIQYGDGSYNIKNPVGPGAWSGSGPHINMTVLLYGNLTGENAQPLAGRYYVDNNGDPKWFGVYDRTPSQTAFYYVNITQPLMFPIAAGDFPLCDNESRKNSTDVRGADNRFLFSDEYARVRFIRFCCEAGFNINIYTEPSIQELGMVSIRPRHYYSLPGEWVIGT